MESFRLMVVIASSVNVSQIVIMYEYSSSHSSLSRVPSFRNHMSKGPIEHSNSVTRHQIDINLYNIHLLPINISYFHLYLIVMP